MEKMNDRELVKRAAGGDREAFGGIVDRHYGLVYRTAYRFCGVREDAEDITQDVFVKLARVIHGYRGEAAFTTWLYRIAVNAVRDFQKKNSCKRVNEAAYAEEKKVEEKGRHDNPVSGEGLYRALEKLPARLKEAVVLVLAEGLSHKEAALALGCAETTISWRIFQARKKLKGLLKSGV